MELPDAFSGQQLLVSDNGKDVTRDATYASTNASVATVDAKGYVTPTGDGSAVIRITRGADKLDVPVTVKGFGESARGVDFRTEVMPLLSKHGCNAGGCHGKQSGQNGFKLSLFGFDTQFDYEAIAKEARGRRLFPANPDQSLFLLKAAGKVPHGGGKRLPAESSDYRVIRRWIAVGAPASAPDTPKVTKLRVSPTDAVLKPGQLQQLAVVADYSDGSSRDVTRQAEFFSNLDVVAAVDADALVTAGKESGEAAVMARHMGFVAVFTAIVPHGPPLTAIPEFKPNNAVDELALAKWKKLGLKPSPTCDDATFVRRVTVDVCGRLPTAAEVKAFTRRHGRRQACEADRQVARFARLRGLLRDEVGRDSPQLAARGRGPGSGRVPPLAEGQDRPQPTLRRVRARRRRGGRRVAGRARRSTGCGRTATTNSTR